MLGRKVMIQWITPPAGIQQLEDVCNWLDNLPGQSHGHVDFSRIIVPEADVQQILAAICSSPAIERLQGLSFRHWHLGPDGAWTLGASPHLRNLTTLDIAINEVRSARP